MKPIFRKIIFFTIIFFIIILLLFIYSSFIGTKGLIVKEYKVVNKNLPNEFNGLKIVHFSDVHYGKYFNKKRLEQVIKKINELNPDIVVLTGDLLDSKLNDDEINELKSLLSSINVNIGKYAINGNHDDYKYWEYIISDSGFINLNNNFNVIYGKNSKIMISGISSNLLDKTKMSDKLKESVSYSQSNKVDYKILLMHEPDYISDIKDISYDLVLAGHSHDGQIRIPLLGAIYTPKGSKKYYKNHYTIEASELFISSGLGTSILHARLFNKPSINFYRVVNK